ncbi:hypothetical protein LOZ57_006799 [Ophidiomyces ophidiicola]|uniref:uncharacterized protein n=1 Tax=Ophidiomyces ophidiicola TaxID=1387563 RepID=UPI0020C4876C|nr:uncharacterized protein LOZ57_006799 [Ophidiomyces ophidiicola]KAI1936155.1 hypothetical protein LOZ57_006799 [Ophidiomyces ophidiicola]KAI2047719.1 hypothetical protein LOZ43_005575 [Ophidiomyces ophidiicola]
MIEYLQLPTISQAVADEAIHAIYKFLRDHPKNESWRFDLPLACQPIVQEAIRVYKEKKSLHNTPILFSHGAMLTKIFNAGAQYDTLIIPLLSINNPRVCLRQDGKQIIIDWKWGKVLFVSKPMEFCMEEGKQAGGIVVQFERGKV